MNKNNYTEITQIIIEPFRDNILASNSNQFNKFVKPNVLLQVKYSINKKSKMKGQGGPCPIPKRMK